MAALSFEAALEQVRKDQPGISDVHVSNAGDAGNDKKKKKPPEKFETAAKVCKVDDELGIVFGWAIICKQDGQDYFDAQNDHIPEDAMLKAAAEFMPIAAAGEMHEYDDGGLAVVKGSIPFAWPLTTEIAKAMGIETKQTGFMIGMKPDDRAMLEKFRDGTYSGFSIGGERIKDEVVS